MNASKCDYLEGEEGGKVLYRAFYFPSFCFLRRFQLLPQLSATKHFRLSILPYVYLCVYMCVCVLVYHFSWKYPPPGVLNE